MAKSKVFNTPLYKEWQGYRNLVRGGVCTPADLKTWYEWTHTNHDAILAEVSSVPMTKMSEVFNLNIRKGSKRDSVIDQIMSMLRTTFLVNQPVELDYSDRLSDYSWKRPTPEEAAERARKHAEKRAAAERVTLDKITPEMIAEYATYVRERLAEMQSRRDAFTKALADPRTWDDFEIIRDRAKGGLSILTPAQLSRYDALHWERSRKAAEAERLRPCIERVDIDDVEMLLIATKHTQKGYPMWVVQLSSWIDRHDWDDLHEAAKELGGWYSSYTENGAVPGFCFKMEVAARSFMKILDQDIDNAEVQAERKRIALMNAKERLRTLAAKMIDGAESELTRDRKTNTARRAEHAAIKCKRAREVKALATTMCRIADGLTPGVPHVLDGIRNRTHVEVLDRLYRQAFPYQDPYGEQKPVSVLEVLSKVKLPELYLVYEAASGFADRLATYPNCTMAANHVRKLCTEARPAPGEPEPRTIPLLDASRAHIDMRYVEKLVQRLGQQGLWYLDDAMRVRRKLARMGITTDESLRHALRAYDEFRQEAEAEPEVDKLTRALIGRNIAGFFPTPPMLIKQMLELADIQPGDVVVEPSCGKADILMAIIEEYPDVDVRGFEINYDLWKIADMRAGIYETDQCRRSYVTLGDWLDQKPTGVTKIVMNPPFEDKQDIDHVSHAFTHLTTPGRIVAIVSRGAVTNQDAASRAFQDFLAHVGADVYHNPSGSFLSAFRPTAVETSLIVINKE